jgi:6-phosphogluconate dehydrogenase
MKIGLIGLGKMGGNMALRLMKGSHECVVYDKERKNADALSFDGAIAVGTIQDMLANLPVPRIVWVMVPAGTTTESVIDEVASLMSEGDIIIDGGNSNFKDSVRRGAVLVNKKIDFVDVGTSGGVWGLEKGYCMMIGGKDAVVTALRPIFETLAPGSMNLETNAAKTPGPHTEVRGFLHCGPVGSGHFVKMVHNSIEYGIMQSFAEGFDIMKNAGVESLPEELRFNLDLTAISEVWRRGSIVSSWLLDLIAISLSKDPALDGFKGFVHDSGEGRWAVQAAIEEAVPTDVLSAALFARFRSRQTHTFGEKLLSAMRNEFGGHIESSPEKTH